MTKLFVYGTLKQGRLRARYLDKQQFLGEAKTEPKYKLYNLGGFPGLVPNDNGITIQGELYDVDDECLELLDHIEGHPDLFCRSNVDLQDHTDVMAYIWQGKPGKDCGDNWA